MKIPTIPVYLKDEVYFRLSMEAEKMQVKIGKFVGMLCENYCEYLKKEELRNVKANV